MRSFFIRAGLSWKRPIKARGKVKLFSIGMLVLVRNLMLPGLLWRDADHAVALGGPFRVAGRVTESRDRLPEVRCEKVRALRLAIAGGRYDADGRLNDLLQELPPELVGLIG